VKPDGGPERLSSPTHLCRWIVACTDLADRSSDQHGVYDPTLDDECVIENHGTQLRSCSRYSNRWRRAQISCAVEWLSRRRVFLGRFNPRWHITRVLTRIALAFTLLARRLRFAANPLHYPGLRHRANAVRTARVAFDESGIDQSALGGCGHVCTRCSSVSTALKNRRGKSLGQAGMEMSKWPQKTWIGIIETTPYGFHYRSSTPASDARSRTDVFVASSASAFGPRAAIALPCARRETWPAIAEAASVSVMASQVTTASRPVGSDGLPTNLGVDPIELQLTTLSHRSNSERVRSNVEFCFHAWISEHHRLLSASDRDWIEAISLERGTSDRILRSQEHFDGFVFLGGAASSEQRRQRLPRSPIFFQAK